MSSKILVTFFAEHKLAILIVSLFVLSLAIYFNRSYSRVFSYNQNTSLLRADIQRKYTLEDGLGSQKLKYVAIGDSLTYGLGAKNYQGTYPYVLAQNFLKKYKTVEVVNLGISGAVVDDLIDFQLQKAIDEKPDFVTVMIGTNDVHNFAKAEKFKKSLEFIITRLKNETSAEILLINIPFIGTENLILPPHDRILDFKIRELNKQIQDIADSKKVKHFDLYTSTEGLFKKNSDLYSSDQFHPSSKGYILWGNLISAN